MILYPDPGERTDKMYERFFYLTEKPFHITPDPKFLYLSSKHREAMDLLRFGIMRRKGFILLTGEVGTGKTTLCRALLGRLPDTDTALVLNPLLRAEELVATITHDFGLRVRSGSIKDHIDALNQFLLKRTAGGGNAVVIIDEAQNLSIRTMAMVRMLSNLETEKEKLLQIVLVGQPELKQKLMLPDLRQLNQRIIVRYHLEPLSIEETEGYIQNRLFVAGCRGTVSFAPGAIDEVYDGSRGIPRLINIICDRALTAAFVEGRRLIDRRTVGRAVDELRAEGALLDYMPRADVIYRRYLPHIAVSAFAISFMVGFLWGPEILKPFLEPYMERIARIKNLL